MSEEKLAFVGKQVKDIYGTFIGKVVGIITEIDGEIESVGVDCGSAGIKQLPYEQLVVQGDFVFFIPKWRLEAQKLIRQKSLTLKRMKALHEIVAENDGMKEDAELVSIKYEKKLGEINEAEKAVSDKLTARLAELDAEAKQVKAVLFDAKLQFRSNEMKEETYQQVKINTDELVEHINNERTEIGNVRAKLSGLTLESITADAATITTTEAPVDSTPSTTESAPQPAASQAEPVTANTAPAEEKPITVTASDNNSNSNNNEGHDAAWLNQVIQQ
ncbi:CdvA-like protein [Nitrososphaera viennensis]|uniref:CdvA-like protein n=2 Tax=Nitrososphaera viennensis TaxID=1034015 RepID=A0A977IE17_9ARCH|nr:CdvA-like protein [Nitrososphaera viennensis]AIC14316.1 putative archaeal cell division protein CdvA with coiled-coil domain [Nitrososphaera viennensis EN76]UVS69309.1 CdvA-like protein [Nitrososphaera viennensis]